MFASKDTKTKGYNYYPNYLFDSDSNGFRYR